MCRPKQGSVRPVRPRGRQKGLSGVFPHAPMMIRTLDDLDARGRCLGVRVDINSPLAGDGLADDARLLAHVETLNELTAGGGRLALLAHQGRPGGDSFSSLEAHAERLDDLLEAPVGYVDSTFSADARGRIVELDDGEVLVLENTRFYSEECMEFPPARAAEVHLVTKLSPVLDGYVNDAFAAAHRSQPSLVGFPSVLPSYAGRLMERELDVLGNIEATERPRVYFLAGAKVPDSLSVAEEALGKGLADAVLAGGLFANVLLHASGIDLGEASIGVLEEFDALDHLDRAEALLSAHGDRLHLPVDLAIDDGGRREVAVKELPADGPAYDIGTATIEAFGEQLAGAATAILNGPAGRVEDPEFTAGTRGVYEAAARAENSIVGGGDTGAVLRRLGVDGFDHVSTGGGAAMRMLCGDPLPAVEALRDAD